MVSEFGSLSGRKREGKLWMSFATLEAEAAFYRNESKNTPGSFAWSSFSTSLNKSLRPWLSGCTDFAM